MNRTVSKDLIILHHVERKCGAYRWLGAQGTAHGQIHLLLTFPSCCDVRCLNPQVPHLQNFSSHEIVATDQYSCKNVGTNVLQNLSDSKN